MDNWYITHYCLGQTRIIPESMGCTNSRTDNFIKTAPDFVPVVPSKVLVVFAGSEPKSFVAALKDTVVTTLTKAGHQVQVSDLYKMRFIDPLDKTTFSQLENRTYFRPQ